MASFHAATAALHSKKRFFFTSSPIPHLPYTYTLYWHRTICYAMARTIRNKQDRIVTCRTFRHISSTKMKWFNNKKQAYGFREREYFKLKIYQLPEISSSKEIWVFVTNRRRDKKNQRSEISLRPLKNAKKNGERDGARTRNIHRDRVVL